MQTGYPFHDPQQSSRRKQEEEQRRNRNTGLTAAGVAAIGAALLRMGKLRPLEKYVPKALSFMVPKRDTQNIFRRMMSGVANIGLGSTAGKTVMGLGAGVAVGVALHKTVGLGKVGEMFKSALGKIGGMFKRNDGGNLDQLD